MNPSLVLKPVEQPQFSYVISTPKVAETKVVQQGRLTNQEALMLLVNFLDNATAYLKRKQLELPE